MVIEYVLSVGWLGAAVFGLAKNGETIYALIAVGYVLKTIDTQRAYAAVMKDLEDGRPLRSTFGATESVRWLVALVSAAGLIWAWVSLV